MTTALVKAEISRFLHSSQPEVLCIRGKWGVGKTFAWRQFLEQAVSGRTLGLGQYAYVSLFGLSSLDALRNAILENTVATGQIAGGPSFEAYETIIRATGVFAGKAALFSGLLGKKDAGDALARALFLSVKERIICIDDLERAGSNLEPRDVLGLTSMLKEERKCKVVLLLNDEQFTEEKKEEFSRLLEKVVDVSLVFDPTPQEAVDIAFQEGSATSDFLRPKIVKLGITNIRIIKKIERWANRLHEILSGSRAEVIEQAMSTVTLGGWSALAPGVAPPLEYVKRYNRDIEAMRAQREAPEEEQKKWSQIVEDYGFRYSDDLDFQIMEGVELGYFDETAVTAAASGLEAAMNNNKMDNTFTQAWDKYHGSLTIEDDHFLDSLFSGAKENLHLISPMNLNGTVTFLRTNGREKQASELITSYTSNRTFGRGEVREEFRMRGRGDPIDPELESAFQAIESNFEDKRDPIEVMKNMTAQSGWNPEDIDLLARQSPEDFERMFETFEGRELPRIAKFIVGLGNHEGENYQAMGQAIKEGLKRIAAKSPLRAHRVASYGVDLSVRKLDDPETSQTVS